MQIRKAILVSAVLLIGLFVSFTDHQAFAASCSVTLLWQFPGAGDNDATQAPPRDLHFGETVTVKAQFRDCQGSGNQAAMVVYGTKDLSAIFFPLNLIGVAGSAKVGPQDISTNFVELSQAVLFPSPGGSFAFQAAAYNGTTILARVSSKTLIVSSVNTDCKQYGADWIEYTCRSGEKLCINIKTDETKAIPGSTSPSKCAGGGGPGGGGTTSSGVFDIENPIAADDFATLINVIARWIFNLAIPIAIIMIIYAGIKMLIAQDSGAFNKARDILKYAIIGLVVIFIGKGFISLVKSILNLGS